MQNTADQKSKLAVLYKNPLFLAGIAVSLLALYLLFSTITSVNEIRTEDEKKKAEQYKIEQAKNMRPSTFQEMFPKGDPSEQPLTAQEKKLPDAEPYAFPNEDPDITGTLVVTSFPSEAAIIFHELGDNAEAGESDSELIAYTNYTPFKWVDMPAGNYTFSIMKEGFNLTEGIVSVVQGKVTRLDIKLFGM